MTEALCYLEIEMEKEVLEKLIVIEKQFQKRR